METNESVPQRISSPLNRVQSPVERDDSLIVCGINLSKYESKLTQLVICSFFLFLFYSVMGIFTEYVFNRFPNASFVTFMHLLIYSAISLFQLLMERKKEKGSVIEKREGEMNMRRLFLWFFLLSCCRSFGKFLSYESLIYINYPTKVLFKNSRIILTMVVGTLWMKRRYGFLDYTSSVVLVIGLFAIHTANSAVSIEFHAIGYVCMILAIIPDSFGAQIQEKLLKDEGQSIPRVIFFADSLGLVIAFFGCLLKGEFFSSIEMFLVEPSLGIVLILQVVCGYCGFQFLLSITKLQGVLITQTVTSVRKVFTIFLSFAIFPKPLHLYHLVGIVLVFLGVFIRGLGKKVKKTAEKVRRQGGDNI